MFRPRQKKEAQSEFWVVARQLPKATPSRFYELLNETLQAMNFAEQVWEICAPAYADAARGGRPGIDPVVYLKMLMVGFFEGVESERQIAARCADSLSLRGFLGYRLEEATPDHSSMSVIRQRLGAICFERVFALVLAALRAHGLLKGRHLGIDSSVIEANASLRSLVERNTEEGYWEYVQRLAREAGVASQDPAELRRFDRKRPGKKTSNQQWQNPHDVEAKVGKTKDGATDMVYLPEHTVDLETGAIVAAQVLPGDHRDSEDLSERVIHAVVELNRSRRSGIARPMNSSLAVRLALVAAVVAAPNLSGELTLRSVEIGPKSVRTAVPEIAAQGRALGPQAVSAVDISADENFITIGTMAFSHDDNVWVLAPDGAVISKGNLPPWAPMQVATLAGGRTMAVGLAYSRVTSPDPTVWSGAATALLASPLKDDFSHADSRDGQWSRWRYGEGAWRTGWLASCFGELFVHGADWIFQPPASIIHADGRREQLRFEERNLLPTDRAGRMTASGDGTQAAFGWLCFRDSVEGFPHQKNIVSVWSVDPNQRRWVAPPSGDMVMSPLPDPAAEFPELLAEGFRLRADKIVQGTLATTLAINRDGSRVALIEHGVWIWLRTAPAIGKWDPPIHALNFVPTQRGRLRVFDGAGKELLREWLQEPGLFEAGFGDDPDEIWCWPAAWFARGMAGSVWLPVDANRRTVYRVNVSPRSASGLTFPDAIADCAVNPADGRALVSCWDGRIYLIDTNDKMEGTSEVGYPARLAWSRNGSFAIAGTEDGRVRRFERDVTISWDRALAVATFPTANAPLAEVVPGVPVFNVGRVGPEHAYVGDIWLIKSGTSGILVDAAGTSSVARSLARAKAAGVEKVTHVIQTHSHGDHAGGAYLWRAMGAKIVAPKSAALATTWLMPMLTDYGIFPPRPLDLPLPLAGTGDETEFELSGIKFRALLVPGHSFDLTVYTTELGGRRVAFTGDLGFQQPSDILHRAWGDVVKARAVVNVIKEKLLPWSPEIVFTGHDSHPNGMEFITDLVRRSEDSLTKATGTEK